MGTTVQHQASPYRMSRITDRHVTRHGVIQVPVAGPDSTVPPCALIKVHAAYQYRVVDFFIREQGSEPFAPAATAQSGEVLKYENTFLEVAEINPGAGQVPDLTAIFAQPSETSSQATQAQIDGGANAAAGAGGTSNGTTTLPPNYIYTKRGRYVFLKSAAPVPQTQLSYPQAPYDDQEPQPVDPKTWVSSLLGDDGGSASSGLDGSAVSG